MTSARCWQALDSFHSSTTVLLLHTIRWLAQQPTYEASPHSRKLHCNCRDCLNNGREIIGVRKLKSIDLALWVNDIYFVVNNLSFNEVPEHATEKSTTLASLSN